jgi:hypothetical protein
VARVGARADEVVVREAKLRGKFSELIRVLRDEIRHRQTSGRGSDDVLERVVVGSGQEPDRIPTLPPMTGKDVRLHELERVPEVRVAVHVRDGSRDVEVSTVAHRFLLSGPAEASHR